MLKREIDEREAMNETMNALLQSEVVKNRQTATIFACGFIAITVLFFTVTGKNVLIERERDDARLEAKSLRESYAILVKSAIDACGEVKKSH